MVQDTRQLFPNELELRARLKRKVIVLAVVERARKKQSSRIANLKDGDANTKFFHLRVNARRRKNHIHRLKHNNGWVTGHDDKEKIIFDHFKSVMGRGDTSSHDFNWTELNFTMPVLHSLGEPFTEEEIKAAITQMPDDKVPGLDGFTGSFFKRCWEIIKVDVMAVVHLFGDLHVENFHWLNSANIALLPKKEGAEEIVDYRPISLIHIVAKILSKTLANRLGPFMDELVSNAQSAFIKKRSIHDNFLYVKNLATRYHKSKTPSLLFKLDIRKAFDSVRWGYLLDLLEKRGFPARFRNWIAALLATASSRVLLNGVAGLPIKHGRGIRQGDPLSPLLFVFSIDTLAQILERATAHSLLHKLKGRGNIIRTSLYADDAAIFVSPIKEDIQNLSCILHNFGKVTGLSTNFLKTSVVPIRCANLDLEDILHGIPAKRESFPIRYLGLPLTVRCLKRGDIQHFEDKCAGKLPTWNGKYITTAGRASLVNSVIASQAIYYLTPLSIPASTITFINKIERAFLWAGRTTPRGQSAR
jgi:mannosylglycoprotein endo-beta-mannosidase